MDELLKMAGGKDAERLISEIDSRYLRAVVMRSRTVMIWAMNDGGTEPGSLSAAS